MALSPEALYHSPNALAPHYSRFRVAERLLLTGHSHQAWPDRAREGQLRAFDDAAEAVDGKWERAFERADRVREGFARLLGDTSGTYALAANTHDLVVRFLSALPLRERPRLLTTEGEFHTIRRQLDRLAEEGLEIVKVPSNDPETIAERLAAAVDERTAAVMVSTVLFKSGRIVSGLGRAFEAARGVGAEFLVDTYHTLCAVPFSLAGEGLEGAFAVGGGYKYCQLGEGNCFLRVPEDHRARPVVTGWFAEFEDLAEPPVPGQVAYGLGAAAFVGATYDPTSHYRAAEVFAFFEEQALGPELLREVSQHQVGLLAREFDALDADPNLLRRDRGVPIEKVGGFLVLESPKAGEISAELRRRGVFTDFRDKSLRLGPAPYLSDQQLRDAVGVLGDVLSSHTFKAP